MRGILAIAFFAILAITLVFRLRAHTREPIDRRREGWFILLTMRPVAALLYAGFIVWLIDPAKMAWAEVPLPMWARWAGVGLLVIAVAWHVWTLRSLGRNLTDTVVVRENATLVTHGSYRWVRHPFYFGIAMMNLGVALATANAFLFAAGVLFFVLVAVRADREEAELVARFGDGYRDYMKRTGRFFPRLS